MEKKLLVSGVKKNGSKHEKNFTDFCDGVQHIAARLIVRRLMLQPNIESI